MMNGLLQNIKDALIALNRKCGKEIYILEVTGANYTI